jgi:HEPN domain-containing protein
VTEWDELATQFHSKAREDAWAFDQLSKHPDAPLSILGFHAQQAIEKFLKAVLARYRIDFPRTHDLSELRGLCDERGFAPSLTEEEAAILTPFSVGFRYAHAGELPENQRDRLLPKLVDAVARTRRWADFHLGISLEN